MADVTPTSDRFRLRPGRGLRAFSFVLTASWIVLTAGTALLVLFLVAQSFGYGNVSVEAVVDAPYSFAVDGGAQMEVGADGSTSTVWDGPATEDPYEGVRPAPGLRATIDLDDGDVDARVIVGLTAVLFVGAAWVGLVSLRRVVRSALDGTPFDGRNVARVRWCAAAVVSVPVGGWIMARLLDAALDSGPPGARVTVGGHDWGLYALVGLGLLALAEVFRAGAALQELEESTI